MGVLVCEHEEEVSGDIQIQGKLCRMQDLRVILRGFNSFR